MTAADAAILAPYVAVWGGAAHALERLTLQPGTIAYFGASVTAQADGYRPRLHGKLETLTGQTHRMVNAGIGGVGSVAGLCLMDRLVLRHDPTLCFVEFLPTDVIGHTPVHLVADALHAIVARLRARACAPVFLQLGRRDVDEAGRRPVARLYDEVAAELEVDSIDLASYFDGLGSDVTAASYRDDVHLTSTGADAVAEAVSSAMTMLQAAGPHCTAPVPRPPSDGGPLATVELIQAGLDDVEHPDRARSRTFRLSIDSVEVGSTTSVRVEPGYELLGLVFIAGPGTGVIRVSDGAGSFEVDLWDRWCHYERLSAVVFTRGMPADRPKTITVVGASPHAPDTDPPARLTLVGFMAVP